MGDVGRINRIALVITLIGVLGIGWSAFSWLNARGMFAIRSVEVATKLMNVDAGLLESAIRTDIRGTFFTASPQRVRTALKKLPWVKDVVVERRWPLSLRLKIVEHQAVSYWGDNELISDRGELFRAVASLPMPRFDGPQSAAADAYAKYKEMKLAFAVVGAEVKTLTVSSRGAFTVGLVDGTVIEFGREQFDARLARLIALYNTWSGAERAAISRIDLRYKSAVAVARKDTVASQGAKPMFMEGRAL